MDQKEKSPEFILKKPDIAIAKFVNFKIKREDWNLYRIEDGSLLRGRIILSGVLGEDLENVKEKVKKNNKKSEVKLTFRSNRIFAIESPPESRGPPDFNRYTTKELRSFIIREDLDFETIKEIWNVYELENGIVLKLRLSPTSISKTSKFDSGGIPIYLIDAVADAKIQLPEDMRKIIKKKSVEKQKITIRTKKKF